MGAGRAVAWTDKPWNQMTTWDITRYKKHLETAVVHDLEADKPFRWLQEAHYMTDRQPNTVRECAQ
ncbi:hypothetical protein [Phormidesmis sp. 146-33]